MPAEDKPLSFSITMEEQEALFADLSLDWKEYDEKGSEGRFLHILCCLA